MRITRRASTTWFTQISAALTDGAERRLDGWAMGDRGFRGNLSGTLNRRASTTDGRA